MDSSDEFQERMLGSAAAAADPAGLMQPMGDLLNPATAARELPWLTGELLGIVLGRSDLSIAEKDRKFADATWRSNAVYNRIGLGYKLLEQYLDRVADAVPGGWERKARARYLANIIAGAASPTNYLLTNPQALKRAFETGGVSLWQGTQNMLKDLTRGGMPTMADRTSFPVGEKVACTPGAVVYRDEIFELLQYGPMTKSVRSRPLVMVPPELNRYYVLDLAPGRSMVEYAVQQGVQTFMLVWRNPRTEQGHGSWGFDDYFAAQGRALDVAREITGSESVNWLGLCAGGMTTALFLAYQAAQGDSSASSATFIVTMLSGEYPNVIGQFDSPGSREMLRRAADAGQVLPGSQLRTTFAWLRPDDLVFNYLVSGWLLGERPHAFDVLAWNDDATAITAKLALESTALVSDSLASRPGGFSVLGTPIDVGKVSCDSFHVAGYTDHITPWRACYGTTQLLGGAKDLVVVRSGHIQSFVNPVEGNRYHYWEGERPGPDPEQWLARAEVRDGSWWPRWTEWLLPRSGEEKRAPKTLGSDAYPPLAPAPGSYVLS